MINTETITDAGKAFTKCLKENGIVAHAVLNRRPRVADTRWGTSQLRYTVFPDTTDDHKKIAELPKDVLDRIVCIIPPNIRLGTHSKRTATQGWVDCMVIPRR